MHAVSKPKSDVPLSKKDPCVSGVAVRGSVFWYKRTSQLLSADFVRRIVKPRLLKFNIVLGALAVCC